MMIRALISVLIFLSFSSYCFSQKPKNGIYLLRYFDLEYKRFAGTCKLIINKDSIFVYAEKNCHRTYGALIEKGTFVKNKSGNWIISNGENEDIPSRIDFKKKIFYSF